MVSKFPPRAWSVQEDGEPDAFDAPRGFRSERDPGGSTRLVISVPPSETLETLAALVEGLSEPLQVLYRQVVDRRDPKPHGAPSRDYVGLHLSAAEVNEVLRACELFVRHDARGEIWFRDALGAQVVLDCDGLVFAYPDDISFRDVLERLGLPDGIGQVVAERDYVRHHFTAQADLEEDALIMRLHLSEVAPQERSTSLY